MRQANLCAAFAFYNFNFLKSESGGGETREALSQPNQNS